MSRLAQGRKTLGRVVMIHKRKTHWTRREARINDGVASIQEGDSIEELSGK